MASSSLPSISLPVNVFELNNILSLVLTLTITSILLANGAMAMAIPTTLDGPFKPVTNPLDESFRGNAIDLPDTDPRVQRTVEGFEPEQISVSLSSTHDSVWISWITGEFQIGNNIKPLDPKSVASVVRYGTLRSQLNRRATGYSLVYSQLYPFLGLQNYTSGIIHHVRLTGLKPDALYHYQCGDPSIPAMSGTYCFRTMPDSSSTSYPSRIAIVGDVGLTYNTTSTISHMISNRPDLILLVGDVTYANLYLTNGTGSDCYACSFANSPIHETYQPRWDYWGRYMQPVLSKVPIMVVEGNHEYEEQAENRTFIAYTSRFAFPSKESGSLSKFYYSFNAGGIHFIMLGAYVSFDKSGDQYKWLEEDLANVDREVTPWLVATWHAPWYSTYKAHYREAECMRVAMEDLLYKYGVDVVFNGHVHAYERSNRVYNYTLDPCGPVHITVGDGGNREKMAVPHADEPGNCPEPSTTPDKILGGGKFCGFNFTSGPAVGRFCWDRQPDYSAFRESSFGHGILEVKNETHALWTWHRNQDFYEAAGDQIYIVRQPDLCPVQPETIAQITTHIHEIITDIYKSDYYWDQLTSMLMELCPDFNPHKYSRDVYSSLMAPCILAITLRKFVDPHYTWLLKFSNFKDMMRRLICGALGQFFLSFLMATHLSLLVRNINSCKHLPFSQLIVPALHPDCVDMCLKLLSANTVDRLSFNEFYHHRFLRRNSAILRAPFHIP